MALNKQSQSLFAQKINGVYSEPQLVLPSLQLLQRNPKGLTTGELIRELTRELKPSGRDAHILNNRKDTYFSQKVHNLRSHRTLEERLKVASYSGSRWKITALGRQFIADNQQTIAALQEQGFSAREIVSTNVEDYSQIIIEEGAVTYDLVQNRARSNKLRTMAIAIYKAANQGRLPCLACTFDFYNVYGEHGKDFIEVHHLVPIPELPEQGAAAPSSELLKSVAPICSNCHRMVHRQRNRLLSIEELKAILEQSRR